MLADADSGKRSVTAQAQLEQLAASSSRRTPRKAKPRPKPAPEVPTVDFEVDAADAEPSSDRKSRRDPAAARTLAEQGTAALRATKWSDAERLFHQALELDRRCAPALIGLSDLHFERGEYSKASTFAERAVAAAPKNAGYRIKLGDVYFKVVRYAEAKEAYEAAKKLGSQAADAKLAKIQSKLGG
jgi:tetratricopeptide (TPR) repeat protein